jgi:hypothetical protein
VLRYCQVDTAATADLSEMVMKQFAPVLVLALLGRAVAGPHHAAYVAVPHTCVSTQE